MIVRVLSAVFFFGFVALALVIYSRRRKRKALQKIPSSLATQYSPDSA